MAHPRQPVNALVMWQPFYIKKTNATITMKQNEKPTITLDTPSKKRSGNLSLLFPEYISPNDSICSPFIKLITEK